MAQVLDRVWNWIRRLDAEALAFDLASVATLLSLQYLAWSERQFLGLLLAPVAHLVMIVALVVILVRVKFIILTVRETGSKTLGLVVSGGLGLLAILQPIFLTGVAATLGIIIPSAPDMLAFSLGLAFVFGVVIGFDEERKFDLLFFGLSALGCFLNFADKPLQFGPSFPFIIAIDVLLVVAWLVLKFRNQPVWGLDSFPKNTVQRPFLVRFGGAFLAAVCLWIWWQALLLPVIKPGHDVFTRLMFLFLSGPFLYRLTLLAKPPVNPINASLGLAALVWIIIFL
jgi:hypothetical protein